MLRVEGTCSDPGCPIALADDAIWCDEHLAQFRDRLVASLDYSERQQREVGEYIEQWLERMQRRARGESDGS